jgi:hypothetical protein
MGTPAQQDPILSSFSDATTLDGPSAEDLVAMANSRMGVDRYAKSFRCIDAGDVTFTTKANQSETWTMLAGEGYDIEIKDITFAGKVRVFW